MQADADGMDMFPVLIGTHIGYFHSVDGGYDRDNGWHVVNLIHEVQGTDSPPNKIYADTMEAHLDENFYHLSVSDIWQMGEYPDENFVLSLKVTQYMKGPYSFSEAMSADIDKRHEEFAHNSKR
jgi:hypothetical protein